MKTILKQGMEGLTEIIAKKNMSSRRWQQNL
jgi:hypothetical protein